MTRPEADSSPSLAPATSSPSLREMPDQLVDTKSSSATSAADRIVAALRARGGRLTSTRRATIEVLVAGGGHRHFTADEVDSEVRHRLPDVSPSTIYRILASLEELGILTHVHLGHGPATFHLADRPHHHLVCQQCGAVTEVPAGEFTELRRRFADVYGFTVADEHFALNGSCNSCQSVRP